jgi:transmembrane sensor
VSRAADIEARAADWIAREDGQAWSQADADALRSWLDAATAHRVAYLRLRAAWDRADRLSTLRAPSLPAIRRRPGLKTSRTVVRVAVAAGLLIAGALMVRPTSVGPGQILSTPVGAQERIVLSDGSKLELNSDTHVVADVTRTRRLVILKKGEAFFDVRHDPAHPFVVIAGDRRITDLGTRFSVRLDGGMVKVVVEQGRVRIDTTKPAPLAPTARLATAIEQKAVVDQGGVAVAGDKAVLVVHQDTAQIARDLSWRYGLLNFNQTTLAEAADEFNRYNTRKLVVEGTAASIRIDGAFRSDNIVGFAHLLEAGFGLKVEETGDTIKISA